MTYQRIVLKISGEGLSGSQESGIDFSMLHYLAAEITALMKLKVELAIVVGGGNFFRGVDLNDKSLDRITADHMGMLATNLNALAMRDIFIHHHLTTEIMSALPLRGVIEDYNRRKALQYLSEKHILILAGGTGNPLVTTDFALSLRGIELGADLLLKATNVDGVYTADPRKDANATIYHHLTYQEAITKNLGVMDLVSFCQCRDHNMKLRVFNLRKQGALVNIAAGKEEGTLVV